MSPLQFFYAHAGYSYDPRSETKAKGRRRCAARLAKAEKFARESGMGFRWEVDRDCDSSDFNRAKPVWSLWACTAFDAKGASVANLCAIDFGRSGEPWGDPYRRVVEAELALEVMP